MCFQLPRPEAAGLILQVQFEICSKVRLFEGSVAASSKKQLRGFCHVETVAALEETSCKLAVPGFLGCVQRRAKTATYLASAVQSAESNRSRMPLRLALSVQNQLRPLSFRNMRSHLRIKMRAESMAGELGVPIAAPSERQFADVLDCVFKGHPEIEEIGPSKFRAMVWCLAEVLGDRAGFCARGSNKL